MAELARLSGLTPDAGYPTALRGWFAVAMLTVVYVFSYVDRTILTLLVGPIRADLQISDTQVSLLHGFAFAIFYTLLGLPFGRLVDRRHRIGIISIAIAVWSVMTALCGFAKSFFQLFMARIGVGVGEAALSPAAYSIITDYFPPEKRSRALSTYVLGSYLGMAMAYIIGGGLVAMLAAAPLWDVPVVGPMEGWRIAFMVVGLPGLLLAPLIWAVREPKRRGTLRKGDETVRSVPLRELGAYLVSHWKTYSAHFLGFGLLCLLINGMALWTPTFLIRIHGWSVGEAGAVYGLMIGVFGGSGVVAGGWLSDYLQKRGQRSACFITAAMGSGLAIIPTVLMPIVPDIRAVLFLMAPALFFGAVPFGLAVSALQQITPNQMRGQVSAMYQFFNNMLGIGCGPLMVALLTDYAFRDELALGYSMSIVGGVSALVATLILVIGIRPYLSSLERADAWKQAGD
ncbi:permease of the major facilitator superfamily [Phenylobacterium zucineum HLK1]|uniref:Permease of the major facilitator superfamily n=1 Tax=Phenylobacterium zucineum (strain HLK1) TaxID=450851 RepID=B4RGE4_PHEZH|nr:MFS transporter [Phenylobacterium zucineum]ACG78850.1 permease of the major facilitator superfamily [Phenylobacterium zucineum HLK1]